MGKCTRGARAIPQNPVPFQPGVCLSELLERYGTEAQCEQAPEQFRWPDGFLCPKCGGREHSRFLADGRQYRQCSTCRTQSTVCSGTLFHAAKLRLTSGFQAIDLVTQNRNTTSAISLKRHLVVSDATARGNNHKLLEARRQRESSRLLQGLVFADDAVPGDEHARKPGRCSQNTSLFMAAVELTEEGRTVHVRFEVIADSIGATFAPWAQSLRPEAHLLSDGLAASTPPGLRSLPMAPSSSGPAHPASWSRSVESTHSAPTSRPPSLGPTSLSTSPRTVTATWPRRSTASTVAST